MGGVLDVIGGVFLLILVYLMLSRAPEVNQLVSTIAGSSVRAVAVLQGRSPSAIGV